MSEVTGMTGNDRMATTTATAGMAARQPPTHSTSVIIAMVMVVGGSWPGQRHKPPSSTESASGSEQELCSGRRAELL